MFQNHRRSFTSAKENVGIEEKDKAITLKLGNNELILKDNGDWCLDSSDLAEATVSLEKQSIEKEKLISYLTDSYNQVEILKKEIVELNAVKSNLIDMV